MKEQVMHGDTNVQVAGRQEVTDDMTNQQSVKYGKEKVEMWCGQWQLNKNSTEHKTGSWYVPSTALM